MNHVGLQIVRWSYPKLVGLNMLDAAALVRKMYRPLITALG